MAHPSLAQREECDKIYVSWIWLVGIIVLLTGAAAAGVFEYTHDQDGQDARIELQRLDIIQLQTDYRIVQRNSQKLDTIMSMVKTIKIKGGFHG
jgi:uncharacterized protein YlxW (UPF0749 family)